MLMVNYKPSASHEHKDTETYVFWRSRFWSLKVTWRHRNMTIGLVESTFQLVVNDDHESILHRYGDTKLQKFWGHEFNLLGSCDIIGHVTIRFCICGFLLVVHCNHASILHRYGDIKPQSCICSY